LGLCSFTKSKDFEWIVIGKQIEWLFNKISNKWWFEEGGKGLDDLDEEFRFDINWDQKTGLVSIINEK